MQSTIPNNRPVLNFEPYLSIKVITENFNIILWAPGNNGFPLLIKANFNIVAWRLKAGLTKSKSAPSAKQRLPNTRSRWNGKTAKQFLGNEYNRPLPRKLPNQRNYQWRLTIETFPVHSQRTLKRGVFYMIRLWNTSESCQTVQRQFSSDTVQLASVSWQLASDSSRVS
jgi:hypothetical protein